MPGEPEAVPRDVVRGFAAKADKLISAKQKSRQIKYTKRKKRRGEERADMIRSTRKGYANEPKKSQQC